MVTNTRLKVSGFGVKCLKIFLFTVTILVVAAIISAFYMLPDKWVKWLVIVLAFSAAEFVLFWTGIIAVYTTSVQLGIKTRVLGALFGMIPVLNIIFLVKIIKTVSKEVIFERENSD